MLISTYNRPDALHVCLDSIYKQTVLPDEVLICDDGSTDETTQLIEEMRNKMPFPLIHVWHEDKGFRKAMILNKAITIATGNYIIAIDGDIFCHRKFIEDHLREAKIGYYIRGCRVSLTPKATNHICKEKRAPTIHFYSKMIHHKPENALRNCLLSHFLSTRYSNSKHSLYGCNCSFFRDDFIRVNDYDESFEGWGSEDAELGYRFYNIGLRRRFLKFSAICFHLWHKEVDKSKEKNNEKLAELSEKNNTQWCMNGIDKYLHNIKSQELSLKSKRIII